MGAFTYPRSEPGSGGHQDLVERLNANSAALRSELAGLPEVALARRASENEWSIKDVVGHLCDVAKITHKRLFMMIKLEEPRLPAYDPNELARARNAQSARIDDLQAEYTAQSAATVDMLAELVHWNWARTGHHPTLGRLSIRQQVDSWLGHEDEHLAQIRALKETAAA
jgi:hypothetical protein